jgi:hypothetical protein
MNNIIFVTAQPDVPYFHWQIKIYVHNFVEKGINPSQIHVVFGIPDNEISPTKESLELKELGINVFHYKDSRDNKKYIPSIKPYLISKWLEENPELGKVFFLHDSDIIFRELPDFDKLMRDEVTYMSDTIGYIGYNYIMDCCGRYEKQYPKSKPSQLLQEMVDVIGVSVDIVKNNQENSGGGQYLIKNTNHVIWDKIYKDCTPLYNQMLDYQKRFPISPGEIQFWTAEMWSLLWNLWFFKIETKVTKDLDFSWATDELMIYDKRPILHMAGITPDLRHRKFYKGDFININPLDKLVENENYFDYIEESSSTKKYIDVMKSLIKKQG